ncbi:cation acetate symporter [Desulforamulus ferrireducens]|uniref:Cation acetate symporter n=1 Tax=Desulforamulus ferrireducens TaxID=1833852 RepID=A0A1S6IYY5_9FIRM|nr:cation acetate symporter [Desulforamulus ferrireducens]AQS59984.1 cation acetate symporter [Desulforamulus ferrireducens]
MQNPIAVVIVAVSLLLTLSVAWYSRRWTRTTTEFYVAGGKISWVANGLALIGDYLSAASFLGVAGAVAIFGIDRFWDGLGFFAGYMTVLFVVATALRNTGKFTVADVLTARFNSQGIRIISAVTTLIICTFYLVPQIIGAGGLFHLLLGWDYLFTMLVVGIFMGLYVVLGGMRGTTYNQIIQGVVLWLVMVAIFILITVQYFDGNPLQILYTAQETIPPQISQSTPLALPGTPTALTPGVFAQDLPNQISFVLALFLGVAGLPHILTRLYTVPSAEDARKSLVLTLSGLAVFYVATCLVGLAAMILLYPTLMQYLAAGETGVATNMVVPMLSQMVGGEFLMGLAAAGAMAAMLSTASGLMISATTCLAHDVYASLLRPRASQSEQLRFAKVGSAVLSALAIILAIGLRDQGISFLVAIAFGLGASTFAPVLILAIWWKNLTKQGVIAGMCTGLFLSLLFTVAIFLKKPFLLGLPVLVNPAIYSVVGAFGAAVGVSCLTSDRGVVEEFMAAAHVNVSSKV